MSFLERTLWVLLLFGFISRLLVASYGIFENDFQEDIRWAESIMKYGLADSYGLSGTDRLPGGKLYILWALGAIKNLSGVSEAVLYKLPANISDLVLAIFLFRFIKVRWGEEKGLITALLYFYSPIVWHISALWGQYDSVLILLLLILLVALFKNWLGITASVLAFTFQFKPQAVFVVPLILLYLWQTRSGAVNFIKRTLKVLGIAIGVIWILSVPFVPNNNAHKADLGKLLSPWELTWTKLEAAHGAYPYGAVNAFNLWGFLKTNWELDSQTWVGVTYRGWGSMLFGVSIMLVIYKLWRRGKPLELEDYGFALGLIFLFGSTFLTRVHERHILPFFFLYLLSVWSAAYRLKIYLLLTILAVMNSWFSYGWLLESPWTESNGSVMSLLSGLVVLGALFELGKIFTRDTFKK